MSKEKMPIVRFEFLSPVQKEAVLKELQERGARPFTSEEVEQMQMGHLVYKDGEWQLEKPLEKSNEKEN